MGRSLRLVRPLAPILIAVIGGLALAQPANVSEAENGTPPIPPPRQARVAPPFQVAPPEPAIAVETDYVDPPPPPPAPKAPAKQAASGTKQAEKAGPKTPAAPATTGLGPFSITCYSLTGGIASGARTGPGVAAADTSILPMGTKIRIDGVGDYTILDRGPRGRTVDIWMAEYKDCLAFGRKTRNVTIIS